MAESRLGSRRGAALRKRGGREIFNGNTGSHRLALTPNPLCCKRGSFGGRRMNKPDFDLGLWPPMGYVGWSFDRASERRNDPEFLTMTELHHNAGVYVIGGETVVLARRGENYDPLLTPEEARSLGPPLERVFI